MRVIIAGSRDITDYNLVEEAVKESGITPTEIISGGARGVDRLGEQYAERNNLKCTVMPADWHKYGKRAGYIRNDRMAENADALIAVWDGKSKGTANMIGIADHDYGLLIYVKRTDDETQYR